MVIIIVWITILMCAIGAIALYIVKSNNTKSEKAETIKNKFSVIKNYEGMKPNGTIYEEYIS